MARSTWTIDLFGNDSEQPIQAGEPYVTINQCINYLAGTASGARLGSVQLVGRSNAVQATGTITVLGSGTLTATINGFGVTATSGGSDTVSATNLAAAINASGNALVAGHVTATSTTNVVTITAVNPGISGNAITLAASATTGSMTPSGARLTGGSETRVTFNF